MNVALGTIPLFFVIPLLIAAAASDLRHLRISNKLSIIALVLFAASCVLLPPDEILARVLCAGLVFVLGFILFAFHIVGGGDVKILSALMLFIPSYSVMLFGYVFSASLLVGITVILLLRKMPLGVGANWASVQSDNTLPMGISIALAGVVHLLLLLFI